MLQKTIFENLISSSSMVIITDNYNQKSVKEYFSTLNGLANYQVYSQIEMEMIAFPKISDKGFLKLIESGKEYIYAKKLVESLPIYLMASRMLKRNFAEIHHQADLEEVINIIREDITIPNERILKLRFKDKNIYTILETPSFEVKLVIEYLKQIGINIIEINPLDKPICTINKYTYYQCSSVHEEVDCMVNRIGYLLSNNIKLNDIRIIYSDESYLSNITNALELIRIPYTVDNKVSLQSYEQVKNLLYYLKSYQINSTNIQDLQTDIFNNIELDNELKLIVTKVLNEYVDYELSTNLVRLIIDRISNRSVSPKKVQGIKISNQIERYINEKYLIYLGAYNNAVPTKHSVNSYFSEDELYKLITFDIPEANKNSWKYLDNLLNNIEYAYFTTSSKLGGYLMVPSLYLKNAVDYNVIFKDNNIYFNNYHYQKFEECYDDYRNYNTQNDVFCSLNDLYSNNRIPKYNNEFTGVNQNVVDNKFINKSISYTQIDNFYSCPFKYYLSYFWDIKQETTQALYIGNLFHHNMELLVKNNISIEDVDAKIDEYTTEFVNNEINEGNILPSKKNDVFVDIYKTYIKRCYEFHLKLVNRFKLQVFGTEHEVKFNINVDGYKIKINGKLDKVLKYDNYYMIIDYKTGIIHLEFGKNEFGLNMQLPFYLYLLNQELKDQDFRFMGAFLQQVLPSKPIEHKDNKTKDQQLEENLRLSGIEIDKLDDLYLDVLTTDTDEFIKSMAKRKEKKIDFTQEELSEYITFVEDKITLACQNMIKGNFPIQGISFSPNDSSCSYCNFKGICYRRLYNIDKVVKDDSLSFIFNKEEEENE